MKIPTKGRYALEIVTDLAVHSDREHPESLKAVSLRRGLSEKYLERIVRELKTAGILNSSRGAKGGYWIEKSPESLTVKDTLRAVEGEMAPVECLTTVKECGIDCSKCPTRETWGVMWEIILQTMEDVTISDLVKRAMENAGSIKTEYGRMS